MAAARCFRAEKLSIIPPRRPDISGGQGVRHAPNSALYTASYAYNALNHLLSGPAGSYTYGDSRHANAATSTSGGWSGSYDASGNLTCRAPTSAITCAGSSPTGQQLAYDTEGRLTSWQNAPASPTATDGFLYDGEGNRVQQQSTCGGTTTTTTYVGSLEEITTSGSTTTTTVYYPGGFAESVNGAISYLASGELGSPEVALDANGNPEASILFDAYGGVRYQSGTMPTDLGFTGQHSDAATTGLDYYGARCYDPTIGQFASADTTLAGGLNRYAYVGGNPTSRTDPSGHCEGGDEPDCPVAPDARDPLHDFESTTHEGCTANCDEVPFGAEISYDEMANYEGNFEAGTANPAIEYESEAERIQIEKMEQAEVQAQEQQAQEQATQNATTNTTTSVTTPETTTTDATGQANGNNGGPQAPSIKAGSANGSTAGQSFPQ